MPSFAFVVESVFTRDLKSLGVSHVGSSPTGGTNYYASVPERFNGYGKDDITLSRIP